MYELTDAANERLLAEAETLQGARLAAKTMHGEGEPLPIIISADGRELERLVRDGQSGRPVYSGAWGH